MSRTYAEAQYSTPASRAWILEQMGQGRSDRDIECMARYLSKTLRVGGLTVCRALVVGAVKGAALDLTRYLTGEERAAYLNSVARANAVQA